MVFIPLGCVYEVHPIPFSSCNKLRILFVTLVFFFAHYGECQIDITPDSLFLRGENLTGDNFLLAIEVAQNPQGCGVYQQHNLTRKILSLLLHPTVHCSLDFCYV